MLVLSRKRGEGIRIGGHIEIVILEIRGNQVRLGFRAPANVPIHREEIWQRINRSEPVTIDLPGLASGELLGDID